MGNAIVEKKYDELVVHLSVEFRKRLNDLQPYSDTWKLYQDMFLWNIKNTTIWLSSKCINKISKHKKLLKDVLSQLPLLDDTLFKELWDIKLYYTKNKPIYKNEYIYCNEKLQKYYENHPSTWDKELQDRLLRAYHNEYEKTYKPQKEKEYKIRKSDLKTQKLLNNKEIQRIATDRVLHNKNHYLQYIEKQIISLQEEIELINTKGKNNNQAMEYLQNIQKKSDYYVNRQSEIEKEDLWIKSSKFRNKLIELAYHYITSSREHENKNLREKYVELFILDDYSNYINFQKNTTNEYSFLLWSSPLRMIEEKKKEIANLLNAKPIQLSFEFPEDE